jgi:hypothetical protein
MNNNKSNVAGLGDVVATYQYMCRVLVIEKLRSIHLGVQAPPAARLT